VSVMSYFLCTVQEISIIIILTILIMSHINVVIVTKITINFQTDCYFIHLYCTQQFRADDVLYIRSISYATHVGISRQIILNLHKA
jgi:hypothetical protein